MKSVILEEKGLDAGHPRVTLLPEQAGICFVVKKAFSKSFCEKMIRRAKPHFVSADTHYPTTYRNNNRYVKDEAELASWLFESAKKYMPDSIVVGGIAGNESGRWQPKCLNSRLRYCEYLPAQSFGKHLDGIHYVEENLQSKLTFIVYLNGSDCFGGGRTLFFHSMESDEVIQSYEPEQGDLIVFDHNIWHSGEEVTAGAKYILRSDIIFERVPSVETEDSQERSIEFTPGHLGYIWTVKKFGDTLLTAGRDQKIKQWTMKGRLAHEFSAHSNSISSLLVLSATVVISASRDQLIKIWHYNGRKFSCYKTLSLHSAAVLHLCRLTETTFASSGADGKINICDLNGYVLASWIGHNEWVWKVSKLDCHLLSTGGDGRIKLWHKVSPEVRFEWEGPHPVTALAVPRAEGRFYTGDYAGVISQFRYCSETESFYLERQREAHHGTIRSLFACRKLLLSASEDGFVRVFELAGMSELFHYSHNNFVQDALIDGSLVFSVSYDGRITRKDLKSAISKLSRL